jgi:hypothetical protein
LTIAKKGQAYTTKGHVPCQMGYDPEGDVMINRHLISELFFGYNAELVVPLGGYIDGIGDVDYVDEVEQVNNVSSVDTVDKVSQSNMFAYDNYDGEFNQLRLDSSTSSIQVVDYAHHEVHSGSHYYVQGFRNMGLAEVFRIRLQTPASPKEVHFLYSIKSTKALVTTFDEGATGGMAGGLRPTIHANNRVTGCYSGLHTGADNQATVMTDATAAFTVDALIGSTIFNSTDLSSGNIIDNDATTVTVTALSGGTGNEWDTDDKYEINNTQSVLTSGIAAATTYDQRLENDSWGSDERKLEVGGGGARGDELVLRADTAYLRTFTTVEADNLVTFRAVWYEHSPHTAP